jgi:hypothetical protein
MTDPIFRAPHAAELVAIYEATPGSTGPGCCPEALAAVLDRLAAMNLGWRDLSRLANELRGNDQ